MERDDQPIPARSAIQTATEILNEQRGKSAIEKLTPKRKDWPDELPLVTTFLDAADATDFLVSHLWFVFGDAIINDTPVDWTKVDPVLELLAYRISVGGRGRADISKIGEPAKLGLIERPEKKRSWLRRKLSRGED